MSTSEITLDSLGADVTNIMDTAEAMLALGEGNVHSKGVTTSTEEKALALLGSGVQAEHVAAALGVTPSRISQLLSDEVFALKVATMRYENLRKHNERDGAIDGIEDLLITKLKASMPLMIKPDTIIRAFNVVNAAKRRGSSSPEQTVNQQNIINLTLPTQIVQQFVKNTDNQVIKAGEQELITMSSNTLLNNAKSVTVSPAEIEIDDAASEL